MYTEPELLNERLERLAMVLDEIMPNCALLVRDALTLLKEQDKIIQNILCEKTNELNDKVATLQIESQNREIRRLVKWE